MKQLEKVIKQLNGILEMLKADSPDALAIKAALQKAQIDLIKASTVIIGGDDSGTRDAAS